MTDDVTALPRISALVRGDGTGEVVIDGVSEPITAADDEGVREEIISVVTDAARELGRAVYLLSEDEQGHWPLTVHPDGRVESAGDLIPVGDGHPEAGSETEETPGADDAAGVGRSTGTEPVAAESATSVMPTMIPVPLPAPQSATAANAHAHAESTDASDDDDDAPDGLTQVFPESNAEDFSEPSTEPHTASSSRPESSSSDAFAAVVAGLIPTRSSASRSDALGDAPAATRSLSPVTAPSPETALPPALESGDSTPPNLADFLSSRPPIPAGPAVQGWQGTVRRLTGGFVSFAPSAFEVRERTAISAVQRSLNGPRTIVVLNPKGGAHKTTATLLIAATFGIYRGGYTLAWDNNETMGTLGVRAQASRHTNTAVDLLRDIDRFGDADSRIGDLDNYVRSQGDAQFDALASDLDPAGAASIDDVAFRRLHHTLSRFYRVLVIDTGNNMRASNWEAAVETADQLVIVSTIREDTGYGAASLLDGLRQKGHAEKVSEAVTILASPSKTTDEPLSRRLHDHFRQLTRTVIDVPYDHSLVGGGPLNVDALAPRTRTAWLQATAAIAEGL